MEIWAAEQFRLVRTEYGGLLVNEFLPLCAWQRHHNPLDHGHPPSFSAGWTTRTQLVHKQTPTGWHFAEKLTSRCGIAKVVWVCTCIFISKHPHVPVGAARTRTRSGARSDLGTAAATSPALGLGYHQPEKGSAASKNKVYVPLVQKANILFSLSSQGTERPNALRIVRPRGIIRKKKNQP